jgi:Ankyrin repeats (3 copies)
MNTMNFYRYLKIFLFLFFASTSIQCQMVVNVPDFDFALFRHTPAKLLAKAVEAEDTPAIRSYVTRDSVPIDYKDTTFGHTLLVLAIMNNKELSTKELLDLGSDPNTRSFDDGSPFLKACRFELQLKHPLKILSMLIEHGADVNSVQLDTTYDQFGKRKNFRTTPLRSVCVYGNLNAVKLLVEHGASLDQYGKNSEAILSTAVLSGKLDIIQYLMIDKKAPIPDYVTIRQPGNKNEKKITISDILNEHDYVTEHNKQELKEEILSYLKEHGHS